MKKIEFFTKNLTTNDFILSTGYAFSHPIKNIYGVHRTYTLVAVKLNYTWCLYEHRTGISLGGDAPTRKEAINRALDRINKYSKEKDIHALICNHETVNKI